MSPDLPYYLPGGRWTPVPATHSFWGVLSWDLVFGLALWAAWCLARQPLYELAPRPVQSRWRHPTAGFSGWRLAPVAVLVGAVTHVVWDEFTHAGRFGATHLAILANTYPSPLGPLEGYRYLQYFSSVFGLVVLVWAWRRVPAVATGDAGGSPLSSLAPAIALAGGLVAVLVRYTQTGWEDWRSAGFAILTSFIGGVVVAVAALCVARFVSTRRRS